MEGLDQTTHQTVRSVSLPSRIHPLSVKLRAALNRLSIWQRSSSSISVSTSFDSEALLVGLANLTELYSCVHELIEAPYVKHTLLHHQKGKLLEDSLDGSVVLLEVCEAAKEVIVLMREQATNLKSALRRKGGIEKEVDDYVNLRKKAEKEIFKHINSLKKMEIRDVFTNIDQTPAIASTRVLRETIEITVSIFRHLLMFLSTPPPSPALKIKNSLGFFSIPFMSSFMDSRRAFAEVETMQDEKKRRDGVEDSLRDLETELDSVFKCLVKNRVLFLNILSYC